MPPRQRGFSFVELFIVILIISLLIIQAMRAYRDFPAQAQVLEGVTLTRTIKITLAEFVATNGRLPSVRELNAMQPQFDDISGRFLERIDPAARLMNCHAAPFAFISETCLMSTRKFAMVSW
ncbi:hypothetical protein [Halomonas llamarensis]|uniref:Prepilin-type N-terminal cleavage/methylation domain-containing protein n=1 Tax=Halomonas llamarensis TaxID=2945104 RepID=A0ABT0SNI1_9GAMM|nr:hypothetical protein [Halomonas llamarensis]MCL7929060.1 hypothetical protein [Halomonas llamarensis]